MALSKSFSYFVDRERNTRLLNGSSSDRVEDRQTSRRFLVAPYVVVDRDRFVLLIIFTIFGANREVKSVSVRVIFANTNRCDTLINPQLIYGCDSYSRIRWPLCHHLVYYS